MYADESVRDHGLTPTIARVNRVFRDKPGRLVVDCLGLADQPKQALVVYAGSSGQARPPAAAGGDFVRERQDEPTGGEGEAGKIFRLGTVEREFAKPVLEADFPK
jgi:hypothetical protein